MSALGGLLVLALVCWCCLSVAAATTLDAAALPLPILSGCVAVLLLCGYAGVLGAGLWGLYAVLLLASAVLSWRSGKDKLAAAANSAGLWLFAGASAFFWVWMLVKQPLFTQWDEFTFWGVAAKILKEQNMLYCAAPGNLAARAGMPSMALLSYFFQGFAPHFSEWQCLAAYDCFFMACAAAATALPRKRWNLSALVLGCAVLVPFVFSVYAPGSISVVYQTAMADVPLMLQFGGIFCLWLAVGRHPAGLLLTGVSLAVLTGTKDMGFAYALILVFAIWALELGGAAWQKSTALKTLARVFGQAIVLCVPVLAVFVSWGRYYGAVAGGAKESVGSEGLSYAAILIGGAKQLLGIERTEYFANLMQLMGSALLHTPVCLAGSGAWAIVLITGTAALAWLFSEKGAAKRRILLAWASFAFAFAAFYVFHLILYYYNFSELEALRLQGYDRYIGPYYAGWMLAMLGLLAGAAAGNRKLLRVRLANLAQAGAAVCFVGLFLLRVPTAGFWSNTDSTYSVRQDVQAAALPCNETLTWADNVLIISQGDDSTRWYYYNYELTANVLGWFGGDSVESRWKTQFASLVGALSVDLYPTQARCTGEMLADYVVETDCDYLLVDRADDYLERDFSPWFEGGLTADMPQTLYRVVKNGTDVHYEVVWKGGAV